MHCIVIKESIFLKMEVAIKYKIYCKAVLPVCKHLKFRCCELQEDDADEEGNHGDSDEDGSLSWLKAMGVQDKIKRPDNIIAQLYPL